VCHSLLRHALLRTRHVATTWAQDARQRVRPAQQRVELGDVRRRLEIVLAAVYNRTIPVIELPDERPKRGVRRWVATVKAMGRTPFATTDGTGVLLPKALPPTLRAEDAVVHYRLIAMEQAERLVRATAAHAPADDPLARDLFLLREAEQIDRAIARDNVGLLAGLAQARKDALASRPAMERMSPQERAVEALVRAALQADIGPATGNTASVAASAAWARGAAARIRALPGRYRGVRSVGLWGTVARPAAVAAPIDPSKIRSAGGTNTGFIPLGASSSATDRAPKPDAKAGVSDSADTPAVDIPAHVQSPTPSTQHGNQDAMMQGAGGGESVDDLPRGIAYPEWDFETGRYQPHGVTVRTAVADEGDERWAADILAARASLLRRVQQQFERLRARRTRLMQQHRGDDIDLVAYVRAIVDRRAGHSFEERVYTDVRPARRGLAISLLVDVSGSTDTQVTHALQVIDVEKIAVLLATTAFDALGDPYNVLAFTGRGASDVRIRTVKSFTERSGATTRRRIAALAPEGGTRLGAAIRHAVALLVRQPAGHRLLLLLSDGRPNDVGYMDSYAVEDARQAIHEARAAGVFPFCLTVDRDAAEYLPHVFGPTGHVIIRNPEGLPAALLRAVKQLLRQ
jgi:nitric oxide reductase NorD protein